MAKYLINKLLIPRVESAGLILEEAFGSRKYHRTSEVALCIRIFWYWLRQLNISGGIGSADAVKCCNIVVHSVALVAAQYLFLPLHTISMILSTLQVVNFFLRKVFGDSDISYGGTSENLFKGLGQGNGYGELLWLCFSTSTIKLIQQR